MYAYTQPLFCKEIFEFQQQCGTILNPWELMDPQTKNDSDKTEDIRIPFDPF